MGLEAPLFELLALFVDHFFWPLVALTGIVALVVLQLALLVIVRAVRRNGASDGTPSVLTSLLYGTIGLTIALGLGAAIISTVLLEKTLRFIGTRVAASKGLELRFESASGNIWAGRLVLRKLRVRRAEPSAPVVFDVRADELRFEFSLGDLLQRRIVVTSLALEGLSGTVERRRPASEQRPPSAPSWIVRDLQLKQAKLTYRDLAGTVSLTLGLERVRCVRVRYAYLLYDLIFDCDARGELEGGQLELRRRGERPGTSLKRLPTSVLATFLPAPFRWMRKGTVSVETRNEVLDEGAGKMRLHTTFAFDDVRMMAPPNEKLVKRALMLPVVLAFNRRPRKGSLSFAVVTDRELWRNASSFHRTGIWTAFARGLMLTLRAGGTR